MREGTSHDPHTADSAATALSPKRAAVDAIIRAWKQKDIDAVLAQLTDDIEYHYLVGERPLIGKDWVRRFLTRFGQHIGTENNWRILRSAESADALFVEGVDDYVDDNGNRVRYPYMGIFEFRDGRVRRWRDYADQGLITRQRSGEPLPEWLDSLCSTF